MTETSDEPVQPESEKEPDVGSVGQGRADGKKIKHVYVFTADAGDGEGVCYQRQPDGQLRPMITADKSELHHFKQQAATLSDQLGVDVRLVEFSDRRVLDHIKRPRGKI